jgi:arylsulfatase A-like enzyme
MKKIIIASFIVIPAALGIAWLNRIDLMLALVKFQTARAYEVAPNRDIHWQQGPAQADAASQDRPPNVIVILADDLGINDISTYGGGLANGQVQTPNIDELAASGANFSQAYSGAGTCAPSRAMLLTGRYPTRTGFEFTPTPDGMGAMATMIASSHDNGLPPSIYNKAGADKIPSFDEQGLPSSEITLAEILRDRGYYTAHIGKWHLGRGKGFSPEEQGFEQSLLMHSGLYLPVDHPDVVNAKVDFDPIDQFLWAKMRYAAAFNDGGPVFEPKSYLTDYWTDESIKIIKANKNRPFFLYLAHWGAHTPLQATREDYEAVGDIKPHRARVYAAMVRAVDRSVGRILATLKEEGLSDNTIVVFSSDNGGAGYIGIPDIGGGNSLCLKAVFACPYSCAGQHTSRETPKSTPQLPISIFCQPWSPPPKLSYRKIESSTAQIYCRWQPASLKGSGQETPCFGKAVTTKSFVTKTGNCKYLRTRKNSGFSTCP